jgi:Tol biopolymer transport system component
MDIRPGAGLRLSSITAAVVVVLAACGAPSVASPSATASHSGSFGSPASGTPQPVVLAGHIVFDRLRGDFGYERPYDGTWIIGSSDPMREVKVSYNVEETLVAGWSPDGQKLLLNIFDFPDIPGLPAISNLDGSDLKLLRPPALRGSLGCSDWSPDGSRLICSLDDDKRPKTEGIWELALKDLSLMRVTASPNPSVEGSMGSCGGNDFAAAYSPDGRRIAFVRAKCGTGDDPGATQTATLWTVDRDGRKATQLTGPGDINSHGFSRVRWSPDGKLLLYGSESGRLRVVAADGSSLPQTLALSAEVPGETFAYSPTWSPDGSRILFSFYNGSGGALYVADPDGSGMTPITDGGNAEVGASWTAY